MKPITYFSEHPTEWAEAVNKARTLSALRQLCEDWKTLAQDALEIVLKMTEKDFDKFRAGLVKERRGQFAGKMFAEKYSSITMPSVMFKVAMKAVEYKVPWGLAYLRLKETGQLPED